MNIVSKNTSRLTKQRKVILNVIKSACYHPTADHIFRLTQKNLPKISVGTVYRNLDVLTEQGLIKKINIPGEPARFDADTTNKAYFVCKKRGSIYDLKVDKDKILKLTAGNKFIDSVDDFNIVIFGTSKEDSDELGLRKGTINKS
jgi:Fe2+ or Zn2+ uptake regulation protein